MENRANNSNLKAVVVVLLLLLLGSLGYIYKMSTDVEVVKIELKTTCTEKESVMKELQKLKVTYDNAIAEKTTLSASLIKEREKVVSLMEELKNAKGDISRFKTQLVVLQGNMKKLLEENKKLKRQNFVLTVERDSTRVVLTESKKMNEVLTNENIELNKTIEKGSVLTVLNTRAVAYKVKRSGRQIETEKARRTNMLTVSFTIAENKIAKTQDKTYYVQVIDANNVVLGDVKTESFGTAKSLAYSFAVTVKYDNKTVDVSEDLHGKNFAKGEYVVNIFDKNELVSTTNFILK